jgi:uncharacterized protein (TIGR03382 family)
MLFASAISGSPACGDGQAMWLWDVTTQNGDSVVEPGETALITLSLLMESREYEKDQIAIAMAVFDTLGGLGAHSGEIVDWKVLNLLDNLTGDQTTTDGVSLFNTNAGQLDIQGPFASDNPVDVLEFEWTPLIEGAYMVNYETFSHLSPEFEHMVAVAIAREPSEYDLFEIWPVTEAAISFQVVPAPATVGLAALGVLAMGRRRRSCRPSA